MPKWDADKVADEVAQALGLEDDLLVNEVRDSDSKAEAIKRLNQIMQDVVDALEIVKDA